MGHQPRSHRLSAALLGRARAWRLTLASAVLLGLVAAVAVVAWPVIGSASGAPAPGPRGPSIFGSGGGSSGTLQGQAQPKPDLQRAENLFTGTCAACHGVRGQGAGMPGMGLPALDASSTAWQKSDVELTLVIRDGKGVMPGVGNTWTDADIRDVLALLQTWWTPEQRAQHDALSKASTP